MVRESTKQNDVTHDCDAACHANNAIFASSNLEMRMLSNSGGALQSLVNTKCSDNRFC
jgi:hypothetical protein